MTHDPLDRYVALDGELPVPDDADLRIRERMFAAYDDALAETPAVAGPPGMVVDLRPQRLGGSHRPTGRLRPLTAAAVVVLVAAIAWVATRGGEDQSGQITTMAATSTPAEATSVLAELQGYCVDIGARIEALPWRDQDMLETAPPVRAQLDELESLVELATMQLPQAAGVPAEASATAALTDRLQAIADDLDALQLLADNAQWNSIARDLPALLRDLESAIGKLGDLGIDACAAVRRGAPPEVGGG